MGKVYLKELLEFEKETNKIIKNKITSYESLKKVSQRYSDVVENLLDEKEVPNMVKDYLIAPEEHDCPKEFSQLKKYDELQKYITKTYSQKVSDSIKQNNMTKVYKLLCEALEFSPKNVILFEKIAVRFRKAELYNDLEKLYRSMFIHSSNPKYFELLGDTYEKMQDYENAIHYYLNYCESTRVSPKIYYKLADVFEKNNDIESKNSCLEFAKKLEVEGGL